MDREETKNVCSDCDEESCKFLKCVGCQEGHCDGEYYEHGEYCFNCNLPMCGGCMEYGFLEHECELCNIPKNNGFLKCYCDSCLKKLLCTPHIALKFPTN